MVADEKAAEDQEGDHGNTDDDEGGLPIPLDNQPGDHGRENKRPDAVSRHCEAHGHAASLFKPAGDERRRGNEEGAACEGGNTAVQKQNPATDVAALVM